MPPYLKLKERRFVVAAFIALENAPIDTPILGHNIGRRKIQNGLFYTDPHSATDP
jgi:hypothetical protein